MLISIMRDDGMLVRVDAESYILKCTTIEELLFAKFAIKREVRRELLSYEFICSDSRWTDYDRMVYIAELELDEYFELVELIEKVKNEIAIRMR